MKWDYVGHNKVEKVQMRLKNWGSVGDGDWKMFLQMRLKTNEQVEIMIKKCN